MYHIINVGRFSKLYQVVKNDTYYFIGQLSVYGRFNLHYEILDVANSERLKQMVMLVLILSLSSNSCRWLSIMPGTDYSTDS